MKYDFNTRLNRKNQGSAKWNGMYRKNPHTPDGIVPFSTADMEFKTAPEIVEALKTCLDEAPLGYTQPTEGYFAALRNWQKTRHAWETRDEWVVRTPGVVPAFYMAVNAFTQPGDGVIIQQPVYYPFRWSAEKNGRRVVNNALKLEGMHYSIDYDDLEKKAADSRNKMLLLCNPHNPVGRVWSREELQRVADICNRNHVLVVSDEIHADLIMPGFCHTAYAALSDEAAQNCIICTAPSKTFNLAGLCISNIIIPNESIRKTYNDYLMHNNLGGAVNALGFKACETAYTKCGAWLDECISVIEANHKLCEAFMKKNMNEVKVFPLEGTYLQWLDFRAWGLKPEELEKFMTEKAYWFTDEGYSFGEEGSGFERLNLACPTAVLQEALERLCAGTKP